MYDKELHTVVIFNTSTCSGCLPDRLTITLLEWEKPNTAQGCMDSQYRNTIHVYCVCALMAYKKCYVLDWLGDFSCTKVLFVQNKNI